MHHGAYSHPGPHGELQDPVVAGHFAQIQFSATIAFAKRQFQLFYAGDLSTAECILKPITETVLAQASRNYNTDFVGTWVVNKQAHLLNWLCLYL